MSTLGFDTETTGLPKNGAPLDEQPRIVQLGMIVHDKERRVRKEANLIIRPEGWTIPDEVAAIHGIDQATAEKYGVGIRSALALFRALLKMCDVAVAHNATFDRQMIHNDALRAGMPLTDFAFPNLYCTMKSATDLCKVPPTEKMLAKGMRGYKNPNLTEAHTHFFGCGFEGAHDAMADVRACLRVYYAIQEALGK